MAVSVPRKTEEEREGGRAAFGKDRCYLRCSNNGVSFNIYIFFLFINVVPTIIPYNR